MPATRRTRAVPDDSGEERLRQHLKRLGLGEYETRAYLALLRHGPLGGAELVKVAQVPQKRVYQVLARLADVRLVERGAHRGAPFRATGPTAVRALADARRGEILSAAEELDRVAVEMAGLVAAFSLEEAPDQSLDFVQLLVGVEQYRVAHNKLLRSTRTELLALVRPPFLLPPDPRLHGRELLGRGVAVRRVYEWDPDAPLDQARRGLLRGALEDGVPAGEQVRIARRLPMTMAVHDREAVLLLLTDPVTGLLPASATLVRHPGFAEGQAKAFEAYWAEATPVTSRNRPGLLRALA